MRLPGSPLCFTLVAEPGYSGPSSFRCRTLGPSGALGMVRWALRLLLPQRLALMSKESPAAGKQYLGGGWTTLAGAGLRPERRKATTTCEASHGRTLDGQSRGTGVGGGGLAQTWTRVVMGTGGARALTGTRNALDCGVPPGHLAMAESMVIRVAQVQAEIPGLRGVENLVIRVAQGLVKIPGFPEMNENKEIPGDQVLAENTVIRVAQDSCVLLGDRV